MKIIIQDIAPGEEEEIIIRCSQIDEAMLRIVNELKTHRGRFTVTQDDKIRQIGAGEIYYIEAVNNRVYLYLQKEVLETKKSSTKSKKSMRTLIFSGHLNR